MTLAAANKANYPAVVVAIVGVVQYLLGAFAPEIAGKLAPEFWSFVLVLVTWCAGYFAPANSPPPPRARLGENETHA